MKEKLILNIIFICFLTSCNSDKMCQNFDSFFYDNQEKSYHITIDDILKENEISDIKNKYDFKGCGGNKIHFKTDFLDFKNIKLNSRLPKLCPGLKSSDDRFLIWINNDTIYAEFEKTRPDSLSILVKNHLKNDSKADVIIFNYDKNDNRNIAKEVIIEIQKAYKELLNEKSIEIHRKNYCELNKRELKEIDLEFDLQIPLNIKRELTPTPL